MEQNTTEIRQLTSDEQYYQRLLNQYSNYRYGREFTNSINDLKPFNLEQQNALVPQYIDSITLTDLNNDNNIIVGFHNNVRDIVYRANDENSVLNGGTIPVNFIYTLGTRDNQNADVSAHYVAAQIFRNGSTNELVVLYYDSLNGNVDDEFENYIKQEFGNYVQIIDIPNNGRFTQREQGANTCGLCALTALRSGGILDQERVNAIIKYHMSQDMNFNRHNIQTQQRAEQIQLSEVYRGLNIEANGITQGEQHRSTPPSSQTAIAPLPSRSSTSTPNIN